MAHTDVSYIRDAQNMAQWQIVAHDEVLYGPWYEPQLWTWIKLFHF